MKPAMIVGVLLALAGCFVLLRSPSVTTQRDVVRIGDVKISADQQQTMPPWLGVALIAAGVAAFGLGVRRRTLD